MSYFSRLVGQSELQIADTPMPEGGWAVSGAERVGGADILEIDALAEAPTPAARELPTAEANTEPPARPPEETFLERPRVHPSTAAATAEAPPPAEGPRTLPLPPPPAGTAQSADDGAPEPREQAMHTLRQVIDWIAAGPQQATQAAVPDAPAKPPAHAPREEPAAEPRAARRQVRSPAPASAERKAQAETPERPIPQTAAAATAIPAEPEPAPAAREPVMPDAFAPRREAPALPPAEEVVEISIGAISVRVEAPQPPAPEPRRMAPRQGPAPAARSESASRLRRHYLRP